MRTRIAILILSFGSSAASAQPLRVFFIGNSFTYYPTESTRPAVPNLVKQLAETAGREVEVEWVVRGDATLKSHFENPEIRTKLSAKQFDYVIVQPYSIESVELSSCFADHTPYRARGRDEFIEYGIKLVDLIRSKGAMPLIFSPWTYNKDHDWLKSDFKCFYRSPDRQITWFGGSLRELRKRLEEGHQMLAHKTGAELLLIGAEWWRIRDNQSATAAVKISELYDRNDHKHPTMLGSYLSALFIAQRLLGTRASTFTYRPGQLTEVQAKYLRDSVSGVHKVSGRR